MVVARRSLSLLIRLFSLQSTLGRRGTGVDLVDEVDQKFGEIAVIARFVKVFLM